MTDATFVPTLDLTSTPPQTPTLPAMGSVFSAAEAAKSYGMNPDRPFFPVNSLRLLYFLIADFYTAGDTASREKVELLIPKVEAVLAARNKHHAENTTSTAQNDLESVAPLLQDIYAVIDTPVVRRQFEQYFAYLFPLQDTLFLNLYQRISGEQKLTSTELVELLKVRAMDSILFSTLISEIIHQGVSINPAIQNQNLGHLPVSLDYHLNMAYQLNDLVDSIAFAKDDLESGNFSPFQVIRKVAPEGGLAKEMIKSLLENFQTQTQAFPFVPGINEKVLGFYQSLIGVIG